MTPECPSCSAGLAAGAVLCVSCGYHLEQRRHLTSAPSSGRHAVPATSGNQYSSPRSMESSSVSIVSLFLFTVGGRISRLQWWSVRFVLYFAMAALGGLMEIAIIPEWVAVVGFWICLWPMLATQIKRWHDMDKAGSWCFINMIPVIGSLWALIELGFQRGTEGPNAYGEDPLA